MKIIVLFNDIKFFCRNYSNCSSEVARTHCITAPVIAEKSTYLKNERARFKC